MRELFPMPQTAEELVISAVNAGRALVRHFNAFSFINDLHVRRSLRSWRSEQRAAKMLTRTWHLCLITLDP